MTDNFKNLVLAAAATLTLFSCAKTDKSPANSDTPTVPAAWYAPDSAPKKDEEPSEEVTKSVQAAFQAHVEALDSVAAPRLQTFLNAPAPLRADYTPWHLDGMIGAFTIDVGGVFGTLIADGAAGVKITWQQEAAPAKKITKKTPPKTALHFNPNMSAQQVSQLLAPAVRMAVKSKAVKNEASLRKNLNREGMKFLSMVRILDKTRNLPGWHIGGFQLGLFFTAAGDVTPMIGMSGTFTVIFDWDVAQEDAPAETVVLNRRELAMQKDIGSFVQTISAIIPEAAAEAKDIKKSGFDFQVFQIGLGMGVGGNIGIASAQASAVGRIVFKKDEPRPGNPKLQVFHIARKIPMLRDSKDRNGAPTVYEVEADKFKEGIKRAITMGNYFAVSASAIDTPKWKCTEIELGLDTAISGDLSFVTVTGIGLIRMAFERI